MIWVDYAIIAVIVISSIIGLFRGFIKEAFSLVIWGGAIWVGLNFSREFSGLLEPYIAYPSARIASVFLLLLVTTLLLGSLLAYLINELVKKTGLTGSDRFAGMIFGIGRGILVVSILIMLAGLTPLPEDSWWQESTLIKPFQTLAVWLSNNFPEDMTAYFHYR